MPARDQRSRTPRRKTVAAGCVALSLCLSLGFAGCGGDSKPRPDREQVTAVVVGFFQAVVDNRVDAICDALTDRARAVAIGRAGVRRVMPATRKQCIDNGASEPRKSVDLPVVVKNHLLRVRKITIAGDRATVVVSGGALTGVEQLKRTNDGWKIDQYDLPVRD